MFDALDETDEGAMTMKTKMMAKAKMVCEVTDVEDEGREELGEVKAGN